MKIECKVRGTTNTGKPNFEIKCQHCRGGHVDSHFVYDVCRPRGIDPAISPKEAAQTFEWTVNSNPPKNLANHLCNCDESPTGMVGEWFRTNSRIIENYELDLACDQIRLYALKDGLDPYGKDCRAVIRELKQSVRAHNRSLKNDEAGEI
jgi:hypothetical protein